MKVGLRLSYRPSEIGRAAMCLADMLRSIRVDVTLFSTDRIQSFHPRWDREVQAGSLRYYRRWARDVDAVVHFSPMTLDELADIGVGTKDSPHVAVVSRVPVPPYTRVADRVVFHCPSYSRYMDSTYPPARCINWGWSGMPVGEPLESWGRGRILFPLHGGQSAAAGPQVLVHIQHLLSAPEGYSVELWYGGGWNPEASRYLRKMQEAFEGRFSVLRDRDLPVNGVGDRFRAASVVAWPVPYDAFGEVPALAETSGTPLVPLGPSTVGEPIRFAESVMDALRNRPAFPFTRDDLARRSLRRAKRFESNWRDLLADL